MSRAKSRPVRWAAAVAAAKGALAVMESAQTDLDNALTELAELSIEYQEWHANLPENLQSGTLADKLEEASAFTDICSQGEDIATAISDLSGELDNAENVELPRGFGKD